MILINKWDFDVSLVNLSLYNKVFILINIVFESINDVILLQYIYLCLSEHLKMKNRLNMLKSWMLLQIIIIIIINNDLHRQYIQIITY